MTRITALIAEDEQPQRQELRGLLAELWPELDVIAECEDGLAALQALDQHRPQVAFLDIRMPGVSGLEVARAAGPDCQVIFITAYEEYALRAFDEGAVDYLQKPVARERLARAIERTRARLGSGPPVDMSRILELVQSRLTPGGRSIKWITASVGNSMKMFAVDEVLFFQAQDKYTRVVTREGEWVIRLAIKALEESLVPQSFWRIHRNTLVRVKAIERVSRDLRGQYQLTLRGGKEPLTVSRQYAHLFKQM